MATSSPSSNQAQVTGRGNIVLQDVHGSTITINPRDPEFERVLRENGLQSGEIDRLKGEAAAQHQQWRRRVFMLFVLLIGTAGVALALALMIERLRQPFDYSLSVLDEKGQPTRALTGELDKLVLPPGESLLTDTLEQSYFYLGAAPS